MILFVSLALATLVGVRTVPCPLGGGVARVYEKLSTNAAGRYDSDLATYASDGLFSLLGTDMVRAIPLEDRTKLESALGTQLPDADRARVTPSTVRARSRCLMSPGGRPCDTHVAGAIATS